MSGLRGQIARHEERRPCAAQRPAPHHSIRWCDGIMLGQAWLRAKAHVRKAGAGSRHPRARPPDCARKPRPCAPSVVSACPWQRSARPARGVSRTLRNPPRSLPRSIRRGVLKLDAGSLLRTKMPGPRVCCLRLPLHAPHDLISRGRAGGALTCCNHGAVYTAKSGHRQLLTAPCQQHRLAGLSSSAVRAATGSPHAWHPRRQGKHSSRPPKSESSPKGMHAGGQ